MPLPADAYQVATYKKAILSRDCHLFFDENFYSAPHQHRGLELDVWATATTVEIYREGTRLAFHARYRGRSAYVTCKDHYPLEHQAYLEEDIVKSKTWAMEIGPETFKMIDSLFYV